MARPSKLKKKGDLSNIVIEEKISQSQERFGRLKNKVPTTMLSAAVNILSEMNPNLNPFTIREDAKPKAATTNAETINEMEERAHALETKVKEVGRRLRESKREKQVLLNRVTALEDRLFELQTSKLLDRLTDSNNVPTEKDLEALERLKSLAEERAKFNQTVKQLDKQTNALQVVLKNAEQLVQNTLGEERPKRLWIRESLTRRISPPRWSDDETNLSNENLKQHEE